MEKKEKQIGNYFVLTKVLGKGSFAICKKGCLVNDNSKTVAVKIIDKKKILSIENKDKSNQELEKIKREIAILKQLNNEHIVKLLDISQTDNNLYLFLEFCNSGSLEEYLKKNDGQLSEDESCLILGELLQAFLEMNEKNLMHRDIKPANILIHNGKIKIADFGFSRVFDETDNAQKYTTLGTPLYVTPQVLFGQHYSSKCDVWSVGAVVYELIYGHHPYYNEGSPQNISDLKNILLRKQLKFSDKPQISPLLKDLLTKMLQIQEDERLSWKQVKEHKFFRQQQEQFQSDLSKYKSEQDPFKRSLIMNEIYLKENLVAGNIVRKQLNASQSMLQEEIYKADTQKFEQVSKLEHFSKINEIFENEEKQEQFQKIYEYVLFERNVAIFYYDVIKKLWSQYNRELFPIPQNLLLRLMFCLAKIGLLFLKRIYEMIVNGQIPFFQDVVLIQQFMKTAHYKNALNFIEGDLNNNTQLFTNLLFKTQNYFNDLQNIQQIDESQALEIQNFIKILNDDLDQSKDFKLTFIVSIRKTLELMKNNLEALDTTTLGLIRYIQIALNPYQQFKFQKNKNPAAPDIRKFYQKVEKLEKSKLLELIKQNI